MEEHIKAIMADILMVDPASIHDESSMDTIERWDSLAQINLVAAIEAGGGTARAIQADVLDKGMADGMLD